MTIPFNIVILHDDIVEFGSKLQAASAVKIGKEGHITPGVYTIFYKITAYAVTLHRSILTLCETGWTHASALLLRTIMECSANCLAIINNEYPEYMAFKYLCHPYIQIFRDNGYATDKRTNAKYEIENAIHNLKDEIIKQKARRYVDSKNLNIYWFMPEEKGISSIINKYGNAELKFAYGVYSMSAHAGHLGMFMFKDNPDDISINPTENPRKTKAVLISSCRWLLELLYMRNVNEILGFDAEYCELLRRILDKEQELKA